MAFWYSSPESEVRSACEAPDTCSGPTLLGGAAGELDGATETALDGTSTTVGLRTMPEDTAAEESTGVTMGLCNEKDGNELTPTSPDERVAVAEALPGNGPKVAPGSPAVTVTMTVEVTN